MTDPAPTPTTPTPPPVDPASLPPIDLSGFDPNQFDHSKVLAELRQLPDEKVTELVVSLTRIRHSIRDDRVFLASVMGFLGKSLKTVIKAVI